MEPKEFAVMDESIRGVEKVLGEVKYDITDKERNKRRSLYAKVDIHEGDMFMDKISGPIVQGLVYLQNIGI